MDTANSIDHTMTVNSTNGISIQIKKESLFGAFLQVIN